MGIIPEVTRLNVFYVASHNSIAFEMFFPVGCCFAMSFRVYKTTTTKQVRGAQNNNQKHVSGLFELNSTPRNH